MNNDQKAHLVDKLGLFYHSEYVKHNQPWVRDTPFSVWLERQLLRIGGN